MLRRSDAVVAGVRTVLVQSGPEDTDEAIVFVHGNPGFSRDWEDLMTRAGTFCRCVAPDMPGFGHSDKPDTFSYTIDGYARHLGELLAQLKVRRAHTPIGSIKHMHGTGLRLVTGEETHEPFRGHIAPQ